MDRQTAVPVKAHEYFRTRGVNSWPHRDDQISDHNTHTLQRFTHERMVITCTDSHPAEHNHRKVTRRNVKYRALEYLLIYESRISDFPTQI